jgi:hypothetical protein
MSERFLSIDRPFDSQPLELNDGAGRKETAIGIYVKYAQGDDDAGIWGYEGSARVENNSGHDALSACVDSSELCATSNPSRLDSRRNYSFECIPLDERLPLSKDTVADALHEDEIFYKDDNPGSVDENDSSSPTSTPLLQDPHRLGEGNYMLEPLVEEDRLVCTRERALDWKSLFAVLLCGGTVRMTVEYYETLRETLIWKALKYGKRENALPGIRSIQRANTPIMRSSFYARSEVLALRKRNGGTDNVCFLVPSEWAILDTGTARSLTLYSVFLQALTLLRVLH